MDRDRCYRRTRGLTERGAGAAAWADGGSATTPPPAATSAAPAKLGAAGKKAQVAQARAVLRRSDHGTLEYKDKTGAWVTIDLDRGKVTSAAADHITLARPDGQSVTLKLTSATTYHGIASLAQIQTGKGALVISHPEGTAMQVDQPAAQ